MRKKRSRSSLGVSRGEEAEGLTTRTPAGAATPTTTSESALLLGPTMAWTPSSLIRRRASASGLSVSPSAYSTGRPNTPPPALTCSTASLKARSRSRAVSVRVSLLTSITPSFSGATSPPSPQAASATASSSAMGIGVSSRRMAVPLSPFYQLTTPAARRATSTTATAMVRRTIHSRGLRRLTVRSPGVAGGAAGTHPAPAPPDSGGGRGQGRTECAGSFPLPHPFLCCRGQCLAGRRGPGVSAP